MRRGWTLSVVVLLAVLLPGCSFWNHGSEGLTVDPFSFLVGEGLVHPTTCDSFVNGEALDLRTRR
jgi:hypothetical protein